MAEVGAAAALSGLLIVAISINVQRILSFPQLPGRAAEMLIMLVGAMVICGIGLIPNVPPKLLGGGIGAIGFAMWLVPTVIQVRSLIAVRGQPMAWWLSRILVTHCASLPILIGGYLIFTGNGIGMYWIAAGVLITLAVTVWNSWILLIEILR